MPLLLATTADPGSGYWLDSSTLGGLSYWTEDGTGNLTPDVGLTQDIGSAAAPAGNLQAASMGLGDASDGAITGANGGIAAGDVSGSAGLLQTDGFGSLAVGKVDNNYAGYASTIRAHENGSIAAGFVQNASQGLATIQANSATNATEGGAIAVGRARATYYYNATIDGRRSGMARGDVQAYSAAGTIYADTAAFAGGLCGSYYGFTYPLYGTGLIRARGGGFAHGAVGRYGGTIDAALGSFAVGYVDNASSILGGNYGGYAPGFAFGEATGGGNIEARAAGSIAMGLASSGYGILAQQLGSGAFGAAIGADIVARYTNSFQFGQGYNGLAASLQVGSAGLRFSMTAGAPGAPQDGDMWVSGGDVYVRSGGVTRNMSNIP